MQIIAEKLLGQDVTHDFWDTVIKFYSRYPNELNSNIINDTLDFLFTVDQNEFSMSKRTLSSIVRLSNEWHELHQQLVAQKQTSLQVWEPMFLKTEWKYRYKVKNAKNSEFKIWRIMELTTTKQLIYEGNQQRHCIGGYSHACSSGYSHIFTLDSWMELNPHTQKKHVTIQVNAASSRRSVTQVRGKYNRKSTAMESKILNRWANDHSINYLSRELR